MLIMQTLIKTIDQTRLDYILTLTRSLSKRMTFDELTNPKRTLYDALGVSSKATQGEIKAAYYKLSLAYHPDKNFDNEDAVKKFREITDAYDVLGSYRSRRMYDQGIVVDRTKTTTTEGEDIFVRRDDVGSSFRSTRPAKRASGPIMTGQTSAYNFDEWTKRHYEECLDHAFKKKRTDEKRSEMRFINKEMRRVELLVFSFIAVLVAAALTLIQFDHDKVKVNLVVETSEPASGFDDATSLD